MLYEFKSKATGNVVMTQEVAERLLAVIGKSPSATGIITVEQMPAAIAALRQAIARERSGASGPADAPKGQHKGPEADDQDQAPQPVSLAQRAFPFIEMLETAHGKGREITWGV